MKTEIGKRDLIQRGAELIKQGEVVAFPTETVYGLGADAFNPNAVAKIFEAKGRPQDNPLIVHIADVSSLESIARDIPPSAYFLLERFSPGPLTLVLKKNPNLPFCVSAGLDTVGVRIPCHEIALDLIKQSATAICAPSANTSSRISPTTAEHVLDDMQGKIPLIIDGGSCDIGLESTVLDLTSPYPTILRQGAITEEMLCECLGEIKTHKGEIKKAKSPGMKYRHYAPLVKTLLASNVKQALDIKNSTNGKAVIIGSENFITQCGGGICLGTTPQEIAKNIYKTLREAEKVYDIIIIEKFENNQYNKAILDRIKKAVSN